MDTWKTCMTCNADSSTSADTCGVCGEASWSASRTQVPTGHAFATVELVPVDTSPVKPSFSSRKGGRKS